MPDGPRIRPAGDSALLVEFDNRIDPEINRSVRSLALAIESDPLPGINEVLPTFRSLMVMYDPLKIEYRVILEKIKIWMEKATRIDLPPARLFRLPTVYGGVHGPDLKQVAETVNLSPEEVIRVFSETRFLVYFIGFICGLAYLGGLPASLRVPRLATPRTLVPAGSVGLAGGQANAIATDQPSGFNYIGRTFITLYDPQVFPPIPFMSGDEVQFIPASEEEALKAQGKEAADFL
jgi:KipI family sensor histidine kinase inhibitor